METSRTAPHSRRRSQVSMQRCFAWARIPELYPDAELRTITVDYTIASGLLLRRTRANSAQTQRDEVGLPSRATRTASAGRLHAPANSKRDLSQRYSSRWHGVADSYGPHHSSQRYKNGPVSSQVATSHHPP